MKVVMKVNSTCDFCAFYDAQHSINDGLWWVCKPCMERIYGECHCTPDLIIEHFSECKFADGGEEE